jgi:hypothetical protein
MAYKKRGPANVVTASTPINLAPAITLGSGVAEIVGFWVKNWASSAKAGLGTDAAIRIKLTDADGSIIFNDTVDRACNTAAGLKVFFSPDDGAIDASVIAVKGSGAALTAGEKVRILAVSPVTVAVSNAGTVTDFVEVYLLVDSGSRGAG